MNTTDGGLHFQAGIDTEQMDKDIQKIRKDILDTGKFANTQARAIDDAFNKIVGRSNTIEKTLANAGLSFEKLFSGNMLDNLKASNLGFEKTGVELRTAQKEADKYVTGMENGLKEVIQYQQKVLDQINQMPEGEAKKVALTNFAGETVEIEKAAQTISTLRQFVTDVGEEAKTTAQKLNSITDQMKKMAAAGLEGSEKYKELREEATKLKSAQEQVNKELQAMTKPRALEGIISGFTFLTSSIGLAQGAYALFGAESEDLNKIMVRLQSLMSVTIGLQELQKQISKEGAFQINVLSKVQELWNTKLWGSVAASRALMIAITGGLAVAIIGIIYLLNKWNEEQGKAAEAQKKLNAAIADSVAEPLLAYKGLQSQWNALGNDLEAKKKFITNHKEEFDKLGVSVTNVKDAENLFVDKSQVFVKAMMLRAEAAIRTQQAVENYKNVLKEEGEIDRIYGKKKLTANEGFLNWINSFTTGGQNALKQVEANRRKAAEDHRKSVEKEYEGIFALEKEAQDIIDNAGFNKPGKEKSNKEKLIELRKEGKQQTAEYKSLLAETKEQQKIIDEVNREISGKEKKEKEKDSLSKILSEKKQKLQELKLAGKEESAEYLKIFREAKKLQDTIDSIDKQLSPPKKKDFGLVGSVAELRKRISDIDELLLKSTNSTQIAALKEKRIAVLKDLAEAEKKIRIESLQDESNRTEKMFADYYSAVESLGKSKADNIYKDLLGGSQNYLEFLTKKQKELTDKAGQKDEKGNVLITDQERQDLAFITEKINSLTKVRQPLDKFKDEIAEGLKGFITIQEKIDYLNAKKSEFKKSEGGNTNNSLEFDAYVTDNVRALESERKEKYRQILEEQKSYEEKSLELQKEYEEARKQAKTDAERNKVDSHYSKRATDLFFEQMQGTSEWAQMFTDMNNVATEKLQQFRNILVEKLSKAKNDADRIRIGDFIKKIDDTIRNHNPAAAIKGMFDAIGNSALSAEEKLSAILNGLIGFKTYLQDAKDIVSGISQAFIDLGGNVDSAFGDIISSLEATLEGLNQFADGAMQAVQGFASGNIIQGVAGSVKAIAGLVKSVSSWLNGDKKREREIKRQAAALNELKTAYENLAAAADKAFGSMKYDGQRDLIKNLEQQRAVLQSMITTENSKKKADQSKINDYKNQINQINLSIENIKEGIVRDVLQTDVVDAAQKFGDALVDNFGRGEDAIAAVDKAAKDMVKNLLRNQLNLMLQNRMKPILDSLLKSMGFNPDGTGTFTGLSPEQIAAFKAQAQAAGQDMQEFLNTYSDIFSTLDPSQAQGMKGELKGLTEKTGGAMESQFNAMRVIQASQLEVARSSLLAMQKIAYNTDRLHNIDKNLQELNSKTKNQLAGVP